jgi:hypothetical protein
MGSQVTQRAAHSFLLNHFLSGRPFTLEEFRTESGWDKASTFNTYLSKQFKGLIENVEGGDLRISETGLYRVTESFRAFTEWPKFRRLVTQSRSSGLVKNYLEIESKVLIYDFLIPLTHETQLRASLDTLFFKDTILAKLRAIQPPVLEGLFTRGLAESDDDFLNRVVGFIDEHFVGYSISHVDGRFRLRSVSDYDEVAAFQKRGLKYLIDETTAITRFIFPYDSEDELKALKFLFHELFVRSMVRSAPGEKEIWMIESGPERKVLHIWRASDDAEADEDDE